MERPENRAVTGLRSASQRPWSSGSTWLARVMTADAEIVEIDFLGVDGPDGAIGQDEQIHQPSPPAEALRRMRRLGRSISIASSDGLDSCKLRGDLLADRLAVTQILGGHPTNSSLRLDHQLVELLVAADVQGAESLEEVAQVVDGRVPEDLRRAVLVGARDPLGQVSDHLGELVQERLLGELDRLLEPRPDPLLLLPVKLRRDADQVIRRLDVGIVPGDAEESDQRRRVVRRD